MLSEALQFLHVQCNRCSTFASDPKNVSMCACVGNPHNIASNVVSSHLHLLAFCLASFPLHQPGVHFYRIRQCSICKAPEFPFEPTSSLKAGFLTECCDSLCPGLTGVGTLNLQLSHQLCSVHACTQACVWGTFRVVSLQAALSIMAFTSSKHYASLAVEDQV